MLGSIGGGLDMLVQPTTLIYLTLGCLLGLLIGLVPGLGGTAAVALLLPFVFGLHLPLNEGLPLLIGSVAVVHHSDVITAVLLGIPGSAAAAAVTPDGHAMARQGKAAHALSLSFMSQMAGGLLGAIGLSLIIPIAKPLILSFGPPEVFMLSILGVVFTSVLLRGNVVAGMVSACLGLLVGFMGAAPAAYAYRYTFGLGFLQRGVSLSLLALGLFGVAEMVQLFATRRQIASSVPPSNDWRNGVADFVRHWKLVLRGSIVGVVTGVVPAVGGTAGAYIAYGQTVATAKDKTRFGRGDPRGLIAPEAANNSVESGSLIPTFLFGIPGSTPAALLLGAMLFYGLDPGPTLMSQHLNIVFMVVWAFVLASVLGSLLCFPLSSQMAKVTSLQLRTVVPWLVGIMFLGAYQDSQRLGDLLTLLALSVVGYLMKKTGLPRATFLIGFVLSQPLERYYFLTVKLYSTTEWITRPIVLALLGLLILSVVFTVSRSRHTQSAQKQSSDPHEGHDANVEDEAVMKPRWKLVISLIVMAVFVASLVADRSYPRDAYLAPQIVGIAGVIVAVLWILQVVRSLVKQRAELQITQRESVWAAVSFVGLCLYVAGIALLGFSLASLLLVGLVLWLVRGLRLWQSSAHAAGFLVVTALLAAFAGVAIPSGSWVPTISIFGYQVF